MYGLDRTYIGGSNAANGTSRWSTLRRLQGPSGFRCRNCSARLIDNLRHSASIGRASIARHDESLNRCKG